MSTLTIFVFGYLLGGITALIILGLTVAARRGDSGNSNLAQDERVPAPRKHI